jgi:hypothetical protein
MLMGADVTFVKDLPPPAATTRLVEPPKVAGRVSGAGGRFVFDYTGPEAATAVNRLIAEGARVSIDDERRTQARPAQVRVTGVSRKRMEEVASNLDIAVRATDAGADPRAGASLQRAPRIGLYQPWTASMDEGWTRFVLEQHEFAPVTIHNADVRAGGLRARFDAIVIADQQARQILQGNDQAWIRPEYRGGIGQSGLEALKTFVSQGGTLVTLGNACDLAIENWPIPVRNLKRGLSRDEHFAPGTILRVEVDPSHPLGRGMPAETRGFYTNSPFFALVEGFAGHRPSVVARYPNAEVVASGWLKGEEHMAGRAAVVMVDMDAGRLILFGLRPQHRAQTQATFPLLFNALFMAAASSPAGT